MARELRHRGPDDAGIYRDGRAGLVHTRLSIIDLSTGAQPLPNEDETRWIIYNGELFNYIELRRDLEAAGHAFRTKSDTEVLLHAYEEYGVNCFAKFNGQWAIAIWDAREGTLVLSRDRVGVRPLYFHVHDDRIWFASELKAMFTDPEVPRRFSTDGLQEVFMYWTTVSPATVFEEIEELKPGCVRVYSRTGEVCETCYWTPNFDEDPALARLSMRDAAMELKERLITATTLRITRADVPVGSYLSGGLDSSVIAFLGLEAHPADYRTYSLRFADAEFDETRYQRLMAERIGSVHREITVTRGDIARVFPEVIRHTERPILRTAPAPMYLLSGLVREDGIKAVLTGEGADEFLAGYDLFRESEIRRFWGRAPESKIRPLLFRRLYPYLARSPQAQEALARNFWRQGIDRPGLPWYSHDPRWRTTMQLRKFLHPDRRTSEPVESFITRTVQFAEGMARWDSLSRAQYLEIETLLSGYLLSSQGDRMLMAHSVEGRFPFLDSEVMKFCTGLPSSKRLVGLIEKAVLKALARDILPPEIIDRPKQPYRAPDAISFLIDPPEYVAEMLSRESLDAAGVFDPSAVIMLHEKCNRAVRERGSAALLSNTDNMGFVGILSTQLIHNFFVRGRSVVSAHSHTPLARLILRP
jgi:asparagine synthase (glutamine-hydrolysing)